MARMWKGRRGWALTAEGTSLVLSEGATVTRFDGADPGALRVSRWWLRRCLTVTTPDGTARYLGLSKAAAEELREAIALVTAHASIADGLTLAAARAEVFRRLIETRVRLQRWIAYDDASAILGDLPSHATRLRALAPEVRTALPGLLSEAQRSALAFLEMDHRAQVVAANEEITRRELAAHARFFARIEKAPLTPEQARAVVTYDNRVRVIAAAGSGKTSVMVARAAYGVARGFVTPDRVLLLAFNADAAAELQERVAARLRDLGLPHEGIRATTFHAFGLSVIKDATGRRPRVAPWVEGGRDVDKVREILAELGAPGIPGVEGKELASLMRSFMAHVSANSWTREHLSRRASRSTDPERARAFLDLHSRVEARWQEELTAARAVDFDAMLVQAAEALEQRPSLARWDLVMVDEFQDTSRARARLVKALLRERGSYLLTVGDDWQAINRFAGADLSVMTDFSQIFGPALTRRLETTFRTTQVTADVAGRFIARNPKQLPKTVRSAQGPGGPPVTVVRVARKSQLRDALAARLVEVAESHPGSSVDVLGRYGFDEKLMPHRTPAELTVKFRTVHRAKGLEADHVVLPNVTRGRYGFPSIVPEDPLMSLAAADGEDFPHAEERRLFYVALTRARRTVTLLTVAGRESDFVMELLEDPEVVVREHCDTTTADTTADASA